MRCTRWRTTPPTSSSARSATARVRVLSKGLGVGPNGRVGSVTYRDIVVRTSAGWRFAARTGELRRQSP